MLRSRYCVMIKKCQDIRCCKPHRSPILKTLPSGFVPAPRVFRHNADGDLELAPPQEVDDKVKYASLSNILSQPVQQDIPFDTYNKKVDLNSVVCPFCKISLCNKSDLRRHRRALHRGQRVSGRENFEIKELEEVDDVREVIDNYGEEYLCVMSDDEDLVWKKLPPTHPLITKFQAERRRLLENSSDGPVEIPHDQLGQFMSSVFENVN